MRDIVVTLLVFGSLPFILRRPYIGVLVWAWLSYMNPHRLTWGFAYSMPFAQIVALVLFASLIFNKEKKTFPVDGLMVAWVSLLLWTVITTTFAIHPDAALDKFEKMMKIQLLTFITLMCMRDQKRIDLLVWAICISIGYFTIKGGIFTIITAGSFRVYGPPGSFITENNALAIATLMVVPLMLYLRYISTVPFIRLGLLGAVLLSCVSAVGSQSRGALLAIGAVGGYFWWLSKSKLISGITIVVLGAAVFTFMPESWHERMGTINTYTEDESAMSRIDAWALSINVANARLTGGGFGLWSTKTYAMYYKPVEKAFVAHSIYFSMLGNHGWPGLLLFLLILFLTWRNLTKVARYCKDKAQYRRQWMLSRMLKISLVAYMSGGAFLSLAYFDLPWHIIAIAYLLKHQVLNPAYRTEPEPEPEPDEDQNGRLRSLRPGMRPQPGTQPRPGAEAAVPRLRSRADTSR